MPSVLSVVQKPLTILQRISRVLPYTILVRLLYTVVKSYLRKFKIPYPTQLAQVLTVGCVGRKHREYFVILFILEYFFKNYIYGVPANRDDKYIKGGLCMLSMGIFAVAMSDGKKRAVGPLNAISGYDINKMTRYLQGGEFFRPKGSNALRWHFNLYLQTAKNALLPLSVAVWLPTFISYALAGKSVEKIIYEDKEGLLSSNHQSTVDLHALAPLEHEKTHFLEYAFEKAVVKTARYGCYVVIGLSNYVQIVELYHRVFGHPPNRMAAFFIGMWGGVSWFLIPDDKIHAYNHWALTTMMDAMLQME